MYVECHKAKVLHRWSANGGRMLSGAVLVEFTLHDDTFENRRLRSRLVNMYAFNPTRTTAKNTRSGNWGAAPANRSDVTSMARESVKTSLPTG